MHLALGCYCRSLCTARQCPAAAVTSRVPPLPPPRYWGMTQLHRKNTYSLHDALRRRRSALLMCMGGCGCAAFNFRWKSGLWAVAIWLTVLAWGVAVALSRVAVGAHWLSDVGAGSSLTWFWALLLWGRFDRG